MGELSTLPYYVYSLLISAGPITYHYTGNTWAFVFIIFGIIPVMDVIFPADHYNPTKKDQQSMGRNWVYRLPVYVATITQTAVWLWDMHIWATHELNLYQQIGMIISHGALGVSAIVVAHEMFHKITNLFEVLFGTTQLIPFFYLHFYQEHVWGHHKNVATPLDPATSRRNETLYAFLPRTIFGGLRSSWNIEATKLKKQGHSVWGPHNRHFLYIAVYALALTAVHRAYGVKGLTYYGLVAFASIIFVETFNYVSHYGLLRKEIKPGVYEPVDIHHSWNYPELFSNCYLFKLQRHSDHHESPLKQYQNLCSYNESPTLPQGYALCMFMSLFPSVWFKVAHGLLKQYHEDNKNPNKMSATVRSAVNWTITMSFLSSLALTVGCSLYDNEGFETLSTVLTSLTAQDVQIKEESFLECSNIFVGCRFDRSAF